MFEMKTTVTADKIPNIKNKFLASYWNIRVFAMFLGEDVFLYTTYHDVELNVSKSFLIATKKKMKLNLNIQK